ncbi:MAG TPA: acetylornithine transaminase [Nitrospinota bacterium]|nr:acetylornithine transaminase [Nitrospinota bacterium]
MDTNNIIKNSLRYLVNNYFRFPIVLVRGEGCKVWDVDGKEYIDFASGLGTTNLGHCHPKIIEAVKDQVETLIHISNFYHIVPQVEMAMLLVENSFADRVFFCNSGAEANEAAIKLARKYSRDRYGDQRYEVISTRGSFHGRTIASLSATCQEKLWKGFEPMLVGFQYVPFDNIEETEKTISDKTCAIIVEPIQGEGGVNIPSEGYLKKLRGLCDKNNLLLILDEVQTGMGRTGKLFAYEHENVSPDIMTLAKSLGGGLPIGAMLATNDVAETFTPGSHGSTFGGNPLSCAAGMAALKVILEENLLENSSKVGNYFIDRLKGLQMKYDFIKDLRGRGLMIGMEIDFEGKKIVELCAEKGFIINCTMERILRFLPPLMIGEKEVDLLIDMLNEIFKGLKS